MGILTRTIGIMISAILGASQLTAAQNPELVFTTPLSRDIELLVTRTKIENSEVIRQLMADSPPTVITNYYTVSVELLLPDRSRVVVASRLDTETGPPNVGFHVLQAVKKVNELILSVAEGPGIGLWRINFDRPDQTQWAWLSGWEANPLIRARDVGNVRVELSSIPGGRWKADVVDKDIFGGATTSFEQDGADWRFVITDGWKTKMGGQERRPTDIIQISIFSSSGWWLRIRADGGGVIGFGKIERAFLSGTFDYPDLLDAIFSQKPMERNSRESAYSAAFLARDGWLATGRHLNDLQYAFNLFDTAHKAADVYSSQRVVPFEDAWQKSPPSSRPAESPTFAPGAAK